MNCLVLVASVGCLLAGLNLTAAQYGRTNQAFCSDNTQTVNNAKVHQISGIWYTYKGLLYAGSSTAFPRSMIPVSSTICAKARLSKSSGINYKLSGEYYVGGATNPARTDSCIVKPNPHETGKSTIATRFRALNGYTTMLLDLDPGKYMVVALCKPERGGRRLLDVVSISIRQGTTLSRAELDRITSKVKKSVGDYYDVATLRTGC